MASTYVNALVGAAVSVLLSFLLLSPLLGGAAAGFLERRGGGRVGLLAGLFAALPLLGVFTLFGSALGFLGIGDPLSNALFAVAAGLFVVAYALALSTVGGVVGVYLAEEFRDGVAGGPGR